MIDMELNVLYEDNHVICVVKPAGILSQPDGSEPAGEDMLSIVGEYLRVKYQKNGAAFVGLVHRLDRNVGGTMIFAKTSKGASRLSEEMRKGRFQKGYFALAEGRLTGQSGCAGVLVNSLLKDEKRNIVTQNGEQGKESVLIYRIVGTCGEYTLVFAMPVTGRTHQIRAQLAFCGHPLADEVKYGGKRVTKGNISYPALWSSVICVKHPTKEARIFCAAIPELAGPWTIIENGKAIELCREFLKGLNEDEFNSYYRFRR